MAESKENGNGASAGAPSGAAPGAAPQPGQAPPSLTVIEQYVKDLSLENPGAPLRPRQTQPRITINVDTLTNLLTGGVAAPPGLPQGTDHEVELKMEVRVVDGDKTLLVIEVNYAGIFRLVNVPAEQIRPVLLIEAPRLLFPFARQIIADASRNAGFPIPLMIQPIDFSVLYRQRLAQTQPAPGAPQRLV